MLKKYIDALTETEIRKMLQNVQYSDVPLFIPAVRFCKVVKVYDGDTIHVAAPVQPDGTMARFKVRFARINAPEIRTDDKTEKENAVTCRDVLKERILNEIIEIQNVKKDKYGRLLAEVIHQGQNINDWLLDQNLVAVYAAQKPIRRCNKQAKRN